MSFVVCSDLNARYPKVYFLFRNKRILFSFLSNRLFSAAPFGWLVGWYRSRLIYGSSQISVCRVQLYERQR